MAATRRLGTTPREGGAQRVRPLLYYSCANAHRGGKLSPRAYQRRPRSLLRRFHSSLSFFMRASKPTNSVSIAPLLFRLAATAFSSSPFENCSPVPAASAARRAARLLLLSTPSCITEDTDAPRTKKSHVCVLSDARGAPHSAHAVPPSHSQPVRRRLASHPNRTFPPTSSLFHYPSPPLST